MDSSIFLFILSKLHDNCSGVIFIFFFFLDEDIGQTQQQRISGEVSFHCEKIGQSIGKDSLCSIIEELWQGNDQLERNQENQLLS